MNRQQAQNEFRTERANTAAAGIYAVMDTGRFLPRSFFVNRFVQAGYSERLAERKADAMIALNTDIQHWSRFDQRGHSEGVAYGWHEAHVRIRTLLKEDQAEQLEQLEQLEQA